MKKRIKSIIGIILLSFIAINAIIGSAMAVYTHFTYPERLSSNAVCIAEKQLVNPETNKLELASFIKDDKIANTLIIHYGISCEEYNSITTVADKYPILTGFGALCIMLVLGIILVVILCNGLVFAQEKIESWINDGPDRYIERN